MVDKRKKTLKDTETNDSLLRVPFSVNEKSVLIAQHISFCFLAAQRTTETSESEANTKKHVFTRRR